MARALFLQKESAVEKHLTDELDKLRALSTKSKKRGWTDRTVCWFDGLVDFVETKKPRGSTFEPLQLRTHAKLRQRGHNVFVLFTVEEVDAYIELRRPHGRAVGVKI